MTLHPLTISNVWHYERTKQYIYIYIYIYKTFFFHSKYVSFYLILEWIWTFLFLHDLYVIYNIIYDQL